MKSEFIGKTSLSSENFGCLLRTEYQPAKLNQEWAKLIFGLFLAEFKAQVVGKQKAGDSRVRSAQLERHAG